MLLLAGLVFSGALFSQVQKEREPKKPVDIKADKSYFDKKLNQSLGIDERAKILVGQVIFHHNGTVISCDSAIHYSDKHIDCFKNVIINKDSTYVYGERAEYNGDINLARVYSPIVKVIDGDATLYTYNFTFNTLDNIGIWYGGGVMYQQDNVMESEKGYYYSDLHELVAVRNVEMKNDDYTVISDSVRYNTNSKLATFYTKTYIWTNEGEIITADRGRYNTADSTYFFWGDAYVLTDFRETWADTIDFNAKRNDAILYGNIQIDDNENASSAFGDYGQYWGARGETMLTKRPSLFNFDEEQGNADTLYMRADTIFMYVIYPSDRPRPKREPDPYAHLHWADSLPDSVRLGIADSLRPVIARLRSEIGGLRRTADSIINVLYPPPAPVLPPMDSLPDVETTKAVNDSLPPDAVADTLQLPGAVPLEGGETLEETTGETSAEAAPEEPSRRRRDRGRGPDPGFSYHYSPYYIRDSLAAATPDSLAVAQLPVSMATDSLSHMEKVRELLPPELEGEEASTLFEMIGDSIPRGMSHLVSDSIDAAALRNVIRDAAAAQSQLKPKPEPGPKPEPVKQPEKPVPPHVQAMRDRIQELTAQADSLQNAEAYIRPKPKAEPPGYLTAPDSLEMLAAVDSLALADSLAHIDSLSQHDPKALKKLEKTEKKRLKAEAKAAKKAEKKRLKEEKRAFKAARQAQKQEERRRKVQDRIGWVTETAESDSLAIVDSLRTLDSLMTAQVDSLEMLPPVKDTISEPDTVERIWRGWYDVKIWRKDMQAVCDSIVGFSRDSTVRMYLDPILWHQDSQIVADSLTLFTDGGDIDHAEFYGNPIMGSRLAPKQFNQVTGKSMKSWFRDNEVYRHDVIGNAEAFYYIQEGEPEDEDFDPAPVAFIVMTAANMSFLIEDQFVRYIIARENPIWPVYPIDQIPASQPVELKGFKWWEERQPALADVFDRRIRPAEREFHETMELPKFPIAARINRRREYLIQNLMWADRVDPLPSYAIEFVRSLEQ